MKTQIVRALLIAASAACLFAQDAPKDPPKDQAKSAADQAAPAPAAPADQAKDEKTAAAPAPPPVEQNFTGSIEFGYRFIPNIAGSFNTYRSVVNLGEGPKLFGADATIINPHHGIFDRLDLHLTSIGDDPYETAKLDVSRRNTYRLTVDWRNIAYFNFLPSYANPLRGSGGLLDANSFDTHIANTNVRLDIMPGSRFVPYLAYGRNSQDGNGITSFVSAINEYPVATSFSDHTDTYRGGLDVNLTKFHANVEEGGTTFKDDQGASDTTHLTGDLTTTFLGQQLFLNGLNELYRIRGNSVYTKVSFAAEPFSWITISGQYVYAKPHVDVNYNESSTGNFYYAALAQFYNTGTDVLSGTANMPHPSANLNFEVRPWKRLRIIDYWMTDRLHNAASDLLAETLVTNSTALTPSTLSNTRLDETYNQNEVDVLFDITPRITVRAGDRYVWGDATLTAPGIVGSPYESGHLSQNVGLGGISFRLTQKTRANADYEVSQSNNAYFRTSLRNYTKFHARGSHDLTSSIRLGVDYSLLKNSDPDSTVNYSFSVEATSLSLQWLPRGGKWMTALLDYTRSSVDSSILYFIPNTLQQTTSLYHENSHTGTALVSVKWFSAGGSFFKSSGSRPTQYYQPLARVSVPVYKHVYWNAEWRYYGFAESGQPYYFLEGFRSNQLMTSLKLVR